MANNKKKTTRISSRMLNIILCATLFVVSVFVLLLTANIFRAEFLESFKNESRSAVETMVSSIDQVYREYENDVVSEASAKEFAIHMVQNGVWNDGKRGFWALDPDGTLVAKVENGDMSAKPGDNVWDYQDADGKYVERELIEVGQNGGGFVEFRVDNGEVNNTYFGYALETDFGFVVDATFDMNYFNEYWNNTVMKVVARAIIGLTACFVVATCVLLNVNKTSRKK